MRKVGVNEWQLTKAPIYHLSAGDWVWAAVSELSISHCETISPDQVRVWLRFER